MADVDLAKYTKLFVAEAREYLRALNDAMVGLEADPSDMAKVDEMFRACHTMKGMAGMMGLEPFAETAHALEDLLNAIRRGEAEPTGKVAEAIFAGLDALEGMMDSVSQSGEVKEAKGVIDGLRDAASARRGRGGRGSRKKAAPKGDGAPKAKRGKPPAKPKVVVLKVRLARRCAFPAARAIVILKELARVANVRGSNPSEEEIDQEHAFEELEITLEPEKGFDETVPRIASMLDVDEVRVGREGDDSSKFETVDAPGRLKDKPVDTPTTQTVRVGMDKLDELLDDVSELVIARSRLIERTASQDDRELGEISAHINKLTSEIQSKVLGIRMIPLETVMGRFPRMVRDIARNQGKQVELVVDGGSIELDRTVIDLISDPIMHILRNCVDHGIETESERRRTGKRARGLIRIVASKQQDHVLIEISDDGAGIDYEAIKAKAVASGLTTRDEADSALARDLLQLLFRPGFSTRDEVSKLSGRGVGLDVVKRNVEDLGGSVMVSSSEGAGTTFSLWLPFTLAIIEAMLVSIADQVYAVAMGTISESHRFERSDVKLIRDREVVQLRGEVLPVIRMRRFFDIQEDEGSGAINALIVQSRERRAALAVDDLMGHQQIVVKSLDRRLRRTKGISGGTILGSGRIALILDVDSILER
ncbi:MAG: chemotaxis protein CheA [Methanobacteriota archaeon]|nr:MAG: chemotaxis protein CheA [Euryarchaeota archaeon]